MGFKTDWVHGALGNYSKWRWHFEKWMGREREWGKPCPGLITDKWWKMWIWESSGINKHQDQAQQTIFYARKSSLIWDFLTQQQQWPEIAQCCYSWRRKSIKIHFFHVISRKSKIICLPSMGFCVGKMQHFSSLEKDKK